MIECVLLLRRKQSKTNVEVHHKVLSSSSQCLSHLLLARLGVAWVALVVIRSLRVVVLGISLISLDDFELLGWILNVDVCLHHKLTFFGQYYLLCCSWPGGILVLPGLTAWTWVGSLGVKCSVQPNWELAQIFVIWWWRGLQSIEVGICADLNLLLGSGWDQSHSTLIPHESGFVNLECLGDDVSCMVVWFSATTWSEDNFLVGYARTLVHWVLPRMSCVASPCWRLELLFFSSYYDRISFRGLVYLLRVWVSAASWWRI